MTHVKDESPVTSELVAQPNAAKSMADMVIEWVDAGVSHGIDWRRGLESIIAARLARLDKATISVPLRPDEKERGEVVAWRGRYEHDGEAPDEWHLFHGKPANGHADWRSYPLYTASPTPDGVVTDAMVFDAMAKADDLDVPLDDIAARSILVAALQPSGSVK